MKLFLRLALFALLVAAALRVVGNGRAGESSDFVAFPPPVPLDSIHQRGEIRLAVIEGSLSYFYYQGNPSGFEYDLLSRYASNLNVKLCPELVRSPGEAALLLASRRADVAVLPADVKPTEGFVRIGAYLRSELRGNDEGMDLPETGALFVRDDSKELVASLTEFLGRSGIDGTVKILFERYFVFNERFTVTTADGSVIPATDGMGRYGQLIAKHALPAGFDWRLIAALIHEESTFEVAAVSPKGASGLMQLMPEVAREAGLSDRLLDPEANIRVGVQYLRRLSEMFDKAQEEERIAIVLAAYLLGPGHVLDAQRLARDLGLDPNRWVGGMEDVLPLLEKPDFFDKTRFGFAQGRHAVGYVNRILERYEQYKRHLTPGGPETALTEESDSSA